MAIVMLCFHPVGCRQGWLITSLQGTLRTGPQARLEGAPCQRLDRGAVRRQALRRPRAGRVPDVQQVVVAAAGQLRAAGRPLQPAHLLLVPPQRGRDVLAHPARPQPPLGPRQALAGTFQQHEGRPQRLRLSSRGASPSGKGASLSGKGVLPQWDRTQHELHAGTVKEHKRCSRPICLTH